MKYRYVFLVIFLGCAALLTAAVYLQATKHLAPCPLCVGQRIIYWLVGLVALIAFLHDPKNVTRRWYAVVLALLSLVGVAIALRQEWIIHFAHTAGCSSQISVEEKILNSLPLATWWPGMFAAEGDCARVTWKLLGLAIPEWSLLGFVFLGVMAVYASRDKSKRGRVAARS